MNPWSSLFTSFNSEGLSDGPKPPEPKNVSRVHNLMRDAPAHKYVNDEAKQRAQGNARMRKWREKQP